MESVWRVYAKRADFASIAKQFNIDQVTARVMRNRDVVGDAAIKMYLNGTIADTHDGSLMKDMDKACKIISEKINSGRKIRIVSDYDVDGVTSNYILLDGLKNAGAMVDYEIPDRINDGYGINERIIENAYADGIDTIITCDNGIAAFPAIELAKKYGMTVVVTDHHEVPYDVDDAGEKVYRLVPADAVVDIKREDCEYPFKCLCGAGVAYKFIRQLYSVMGISWTDETRYMDILAIGTVCDVMELVDENRIFVREGLKLLEHTHNIGLRTLIDLCGLSGKKLYAHNLGFIIGPCINATGRLDTAKEGLKLLLCEDEKKATEIATKLVKLNEERKEMTNKGVDLATLLAKEQYVADDVLVIYLPDLHESIAGLVASKIKDKFYKPTLIFTDAKDGLLKGSGRSIEGYHMFDALNNHKDLFVKYGGHALAAGFSIQKDKLDELRTVLNADKFLNDEILTPKVMIDVAMPFSYVSYDLIDDLEKLEPFGNGNEKPVFAQSNLRLINGRLLGKDNRYIRLTFADDKGNRVEAMEFDAAGFIDCIKLWFSEQECDKMLKGQPNEIVLDVCYYPVVNEYMGRRSIQIKPIKYHR